MVIRRTLISTGSLSGQWYALSFRVGRSDPCVEAFKCQPETPPAQAAIYHLSPAILIRSLELVAGVD